MRRTPKLNVPGAGVADQKIERCIAHMLGHLKERVTVASLAKMVNLSSAHFTALFKQKTGYPPINFFIRLRIHQACHLLTVNNLSVREVATTLGYRDPFFFSRQFKLINGAAPNNYRATGPNVAPPNFKDMVATNLSHCHSHAGVVQHINAPDGDNE